MTLSNFSRKVVTIVTLSRAVVNLIRVNLQFFRLKN